MRTPLLFSLLLLPAAAVIADPQADSTPVVDRAPFINKQVRELKTQIDKDLASGALTQTDADGLKREVADVLRIEDSEPELTPRTRRDLREKVSGIVMELDRDEKRTRATASASPSDSP